ncbi:MAG: MarR family transcriptional regulator [Gemmatimonadetes bacterium]|nr:MarR family transcriptional regulator [Gemmatimonadota bacterium]
MTTTGLAHAPLPILAVAAHGDSMVVHDARLLSEALSELLRVIQFRDRDRVCCYDVSVSQCYALRGIVRAEGLTVNDLAAYLYVDKSTASRIANSLVDKDYVVREAHPDDARAVRLLPTPRGRAILATIAADEERDYTALLADFDPGTRAELYRLIGRLKSCFVSGVEAAAGTCCVVK